MNNNAETFAAGTDRVATVSLQRVLAQIPLDPNPVRPAMGVINRIHRYKQGERK